MGNVQSVLIGDFLHRIRRPISLIDNKKYKLVTIKMNHKGIVLREEKLASNIKSKMYEVKEGDFILSGIDARNGAFGIVPKELDGAIVTNDFWYFDIDESIVDKQLFLELTSTKWFDEICRKGSDGTTQRIRLQKNKFFNQKINIPPREEQSTFISTFRRNKQNNNNLKEELTHQQTLLKKLRHQILQEAIEGKLTADWREKNPDVEQASELLARIQAEKAQLIKDKKIKKQKPLPPISEEEKPFELPDGWVWCRLGEILEFLTDYHANGAYEKLKKNVQLLDRPNFAIMLRTTNFHYKSKFKYKYITESAYNFLSKSKVYPEDLIMNKIADPGAVFFVDDRKQPMSLAMNLFLLRFNKETISSRYAYFYLKSSYEYVVSFSSGTATSTITKDAVNKLRFPLPPLQEQKAIVAKVEKLLALCDQLESQITDNQHHAKQLMQAVLKEAFSQA